MDVAHPGNDPAVGLLNVIANPVGKDVLQLLPRYRVGVGVDEEVGLVVAAIVVPKIGGTKGGAL